MIVSNDRNYKKFKSLGYDFNIGDVISVKLDHLDQNLMKKEYSINSGYNFLFLIDKDYTELEKIITNNGNYSTI